MNDSNQASNGSADDKWSPNADERCSVHSAAIPGVLALSPNTHRISSRWVAIAIIIAVWAMAYLALTAQQLMNALPGRGWWYLVPRAISCLLGALISFGIFLVQVRLRQFGPTARAFAALILALAGTALFAVVNYPIYLPFVPADVPLSPLWIAYSGDFLTRLWIFGSISGVILALTYVADIHEREQRINALQALAHAAQLRALRNQQNPHFLFNALNSIAGLMSRKRVADAEAMTVNLADFLRTTLALDPQQEITLDEEIRLQGLYLDIEKVRFPERLDVRVNISDGLGRALVPSLITQPLIENSIKYAVARSTERVQIRISATSHGDRLELAVEDDGGNAQTDSPKGARLGLSNVAGRLSAHYGGEASLDATKKEAGGFRNLIRMPLRFD